MTRVTVPLLVPLARFVLIYAGLVVLALRLWERPVALAGAFLVISVIMLALWREGTTWAMFLVAAVMGPAAEYFAVRAGAWIYPVAHWTLPLWLPLAWGLAAAIFLRLSLVISATVGESSNRA